MNLKHEAGALRFIGVRYDGTGMEYLSDTLEGSGHPTLHPDGRHIVTDVYARARLSWPDGTTAIRWIDLDEHVATNLIRIRTLPDFEGPKRQVRVDPHPAWDCRFRRVAFNACPDGGRRVFVAELATLLG
jgi:hypothetical protein